MQNIINFQFRNEREVELGILWTLKDKNLVSFNEMFRFLEKQNLPESIQDKIENMN